MTFCFLVGPGMGNRGARSCLVAMTGHVDMGQFNRFLKRTIQLCVSSEGLLHSEAVDWGWS